MRYFGKSDFADVFLLLATASGDEWAHRFEQSPDHPRNLRRPPTPQAAADLPAAGPPRQQRVLTQLAVLTRRYVAVIPSDRQYAVFLAALPLVLSLLARAVPGSAGLSVAAARAGDDPQPRQLLLVLIIGAALMGAAAAVRELVKERPVYRRERAIGLSIEGTWPPRCSSSGWWSGCRPHCSRSSRFSAATVPTTRSCCLRDAQRSCSRWSPSPWPAWSPGC